MSTATQGKTMTRRQRLRAIFWGKTPDRPAVKLWGANIGQKMLHPDYQPVYEAAIAKTDLTPHYGGRFHMFCGIHGEKLIEQRTVPTDSPLWQDHITTYHTPEGDLTSIFTGSTVKQPGYIKRHLLQEPGDIRKLLSLPYEPFAFDLEPCRKFERELGEQGLPIFGLHHAMYAFQDAVGSENFAMWHLECPELVREAISVFAQRLYAHAKAVLASGIRPLFGWVGPELCIPPLMSPASFEEYVFAVDKPLIDLIHEADCRVWVHCHGKMKQMIERFAAMGVDVLNPIEPPPMGDVSLAEAFALVGPGMGLEGNIENHDLMLATPETVVAKIKAALAASAGKRFILCPCSGYMEDPQPTARFIANLLLYVNEGTRLAQEMA